MAKEVTVVVTVGGTRTEFEHEVAAPKPAG